MSAVGSCIGVCIYQGTLHPGLLALLLLWTLISIEKAANREIAETIWSLMTAFTVLAVWLLIPINQLLILYNQTRTSGLISYFMLSLAGPVLIGECIYGLVASIRPICVWYPAACGNSLLMLVLNIAIWDLFLGVSLFACYLCITSSLFYISKTLSKRRYRQARLALIGQIDPFSASSLCAICLESLNNQPIRLRCGHPFHGQCLERWLTRRMVCPVCRAAVLAY